MRFPRRELWGVPVLDSKIFGARNGCRIATSAVYYTCYFRVVADLSSQVGISEGIISVDSIESDNQNLNQNLVQE